MKRRNIASRGFSLVELLVALVFTSILMAGMFRIFTTSTAGFQAAQELMAAQRVGRWAFDTVTQDIQQAGNWVPLRIKAPTYLTTGTEPVFQITPGISVNLTRISDSNPSATEAETVTTDQMVFLSDVPLDIEATLGADVAAGTTTTFTVAYQAGRGATPQAGDLVFIRDANAEIATVASVSGSTITLDTTVNQSLGLQPAIGVAGPHWAGAAVSFFRPLQLVRYWIQARSLDPSNTAVTVPCLVRQQLPYPTSGAAVWANATETIVAENVSGFTVDMSFDGGTTWARTGAANWAAIQANADTQLATYGPPGFTSITNTAMSGWPMWYRSIPCLFRVDITTRSAVRRTEFVQGATPTSRAYGSKTMTLMITPRNFGLGV